MAAFPSAPSPSAAAEIDVCRPSWNGRGYIDLAGETFRAEAELLEQRLFGAESVPKAGTKTT